MPINKPHPATWYRARIIAIDQLLEVLQTQMERSKTKDEFRKIELEHCRLRKGMVPSRYRKAWDTRIERAFKKHFPQQFKQWKARQAVDEEALQFHELTAFNTFYRINPDKILGKEHPHTGWSFPILIQGTISQAKQAMNKHLAALGTNLNIQPRQCTKPTGTNEQDNSELQQLLQQLQDLKL